MNISASSASLHSKEKARAMANINENIHNKVESMIATKKLPEKVYMNHPPKKQAPMNYKIVEDENATKGWNNHFNSTYKKYDPEKDGPKLANNIN